MTKWDYFFHVWLVDILLLSMMAIVCWYVLFTGLQPPVHSETIQRKSDTHVLGEDTEAFYIYDAPER